MTESSLIPAEEAHDWTLGSGALYDYASIWKDFQHGGDALDFTLDGVSAGLDTFMLVADPFASLVSSAVGWVLENIPGVRDAWNMLSGDPEAIQRAALTWKNISVQMDECATTFADDAKQIENWNGAAAQSFFRVAEDYESVLRGISGDAEMLSVVITGAGCVVAALREIVYWVIAKWLEEDVIPEALASLATSWCTFGGSVAAFLTWLIVSTSMTTGVIGEKIAACSVKIAELYAKIAELLAKAATAARAGEQAAQGLKAAAQKAAEILDNPAIGATRAGGRHVENRHKGEQEGAEEGEEGGGAEGGEGGE